MLWKVPYGLSPRLYSRIQLLDPAIRQRTAGFFGSTEKYKFRHIPVCFYNALFWCASVFLQARFFVPCFRKCECDSPGCRSPPSDFDFACQLKNRNWRNLLCSKSILKITIPIL